MRKYLLSAATLALLTSPSLAQTATGVGVGTGVANSSSRSGAVAISGQGGRGGNSSLVINNPANTTSTVNSNVNQSGTTTQNINQNVNGLTRTESVVSGTTTVRNAPGIVAPGLSAAGLETCLGSASGGLSVVGFGLTAGSSTPDPNCNARLDARTLWSIGLKKAAVARLCLSEPIYRSMPEVCDVYLPRVQPVGYPAPVPVGYEAPYNGGYIMLIDGATGKERMCSNYNAKGQKCRQWADAKPKSKPVALVSSAPPVPQN